MRSSSSVNEGGMLPENLLPESHTFFKEVNWEKKSPGIGPENWFCWRRRDFMAPSLWNCGIGPVKELLTKLRVLKPRISTMASTSIVPES